jgi:hypothetical protein
MRSDVPHQANTFLDTQRPRRQFANHWQHVFLLWATPRTILLVIRKVWNDPMRVLAGRRWRRHNGRRLAVIYATAALVDFVALFVGDEHAAALIPTATHQSLVGSIAAVEVFNSPNDPGHMSPGDYFLEISVRQNEASKRIVEIQYVWKQRLRCLRRHRWCGWRGAFRQYASFESSSHPKMLGSCPCSLCERKFFE